MGAGAAAVKPIAAGSQKGKKDPDLSGREDRPGLGRLTMKMVWTNRSAAFVAKDLGRIQTLT